MPDARKGQLPCSQHCAYRTATTLTVLLLLVIVSVGVPVALEALWGAVVTQMLRHTAPDANYALQGRLLLRMYTAEGANAWHVAPEPSASQLEGPVRRALLWDVLDADRLVSTTAEHIRLYSYPTKDTICCGDGATCYMVWRCHGGHICVALQDNVSTALQGDAGKEHDVA